jgi:hypothetical protein
VATNDPLNPGKRAANRGAAALERGRAPRWELAEVLSFNTATHTSVIRTHSGRPLRDVPQLRTGPGAFEHLETGTTVVVSYDLGFPAIIGCISMVGPGTGPVSPADVTGVSGAGDDNPLVPTRGTNNYKPPYAPVDMAQGDWVRVGTMGNHIGVLEGGVSSMGSPTALVRSLGLAGVLQLVSRTMQTYTDFGQWRVENDQGRTSFVLRAGADQSTQTGADEQHWTIRLDVGATGDLFNFRITEPDGRTVFRMHVSGDGRVQIYGDGGVDISSGPGADATTAHDIDGKRAVRISGTDTLETGETRTTKIGQADQTTVGTDKTTVVGASEARFVNNDLTTSVGGKKTEIVVGGADTRIVNGAWKLHVGDPADGATPATSSSLDLKTGLGDINAASGGAMTLRAKQTATLEGPHVKLGERAKHPLPKFDDFQKELAKFLSRLLSVLQAGTVGGSGAQRLAALDAALPMLRAFVQKVAGKTTFQSNKVKNE